MTHNLAMQQEPGAVVYTQPNEGAWMTSPESVAGCPPGLEYLAQVDQLIIKQQVELLEVITGFETKNKYRIFNSMGQQVYFAKEESTCLRRQFCGPRREFHVHITDNNNQEVLRFFRRFKCCAGCCWCANQDCCAWELQAELPSGEVIGYVKQRGSRWSPHLAVYTAAWEKFGVIRGPCCPCNGPCCGDLDFTVMTKDERSSLGRVAKQWSGGLHELFSDADHFCVTFPIDMGVRSKATMLGALFLIDFMFFETDQNNR